jgi:hypothetical protein
MAMKKIIGSCLTCAWLLALGACAVDSPKTTTNERRQPTAKVRDYSAQTDSNRSMNGPPR